MKTHNEVQDLPQTEIISQKSLIREILFDRFLFNPEISWQFKVAATPLLFVFITGVAYFSFPIQTVAAIKFVIEAGDYYVVGMFWRALQVFFLIWCLWNWKNIFSWINDLYIDGKNMKLPHYGRPKKNTIQGIPSSDILDFLLENGGFPQADFVKEFSSDNSAKLHRSISFLLKNMGVIENIKSEKNRLLIRDDISMYQLEILFKNFDIFTKYPALFPVQKYWNEWEDEFDKISRIEEQKRKEKKYQKITKKTGFHIKKV